MSERISFVAAPLVDGLLEADGALNPAAVDRIGQAQDHGVRFALVTDRPPMAATSVARRIDLAAFIVAYDGALALAPPNQTRLVATPIPEAAVSAWLATTDGPGIVRAVGYPDICLADAADFDGALLRHWLAMTPRQVTNLTASLAATKAEPLALYAIAAPERLAAIQARLEAGDFTVDLEFRRLGQALALWRSPWAGVGATLALILDSLRLRPATGLAIGVAAADRSMFAAVGAKAALANAAPIVKSAADYVAKGSGGAGIAEILERCGL